MRTSNQCSHKIQSHKVVAQYRFSFLLTWNGRSDYLSCQTLCEIWLLNILVNKVKIATGEIHKLVNRPKQLWNNKWVIKYCNQSWEHCWHVPWIAYFGKYSGQNVMVFCLPGGISGVIEPPWSSSAEAGCFLVLAAVVHTGLKLHTSFME